LTRSKPDSEVPLGHEQDFKFLSEINARSQKDENHCYKDCQGKQLLQKHLLCWESLGMTDAMLVLVGQE
jgi:hypothetical protein